MTPREVQMTIRAASERQFDRLDSLVYAVWHGALWGHADGRKLKMPDLIDAYPKRRRRGVRPPRTVEANVARWERWAKAGNWREVN
mgnify:CR=1 FL=1